MPDFIDNPKKEPRKRKARAQALRQEPRASSEVVEGDSLASLLEEADREVMRLHGGEDIGAVENRNKLTILQYQVATLKSVLDDVSRVDAIINKSDVYALNSLAVLKLKALKAQSELMSTLKAVGML